MQQFRALDLTERIKRAEQASEQKNIPATLAAFDLHVYAAALNAMLGNSNPVTTINCPVAIPVNCTIQVTWNEKAVALNSQGVVANLQAFAPTYTLYVEP